MTGFQKKLLVPIAAAVVVAAPVNAAAPAQPGAPDLARVKAGTYKADPNHTQVIWTVNHMGLTPLSAAISASGGTLEIDPAHPERAKVSVDFRIADTATTAAEFAHHLMTEEILDAARFPGASFVSTRVVPKGRTATIYGNLTVHGVTKPVVLAAQYFGAGANPRSKALTLGFTAKARISRSDFGLSYAVPLVSDAVDLDIRGAFELPAN